ncbi:MAG: LacI family DNA-binding transcriptional regulator [Paeniglutamicibacter sp.]
MARAAGVHASTVSRVLRQQQPEGGWSESAARILGIAKELGYRPNFIAAGLRTSRSRTIGVLMPRLTDGVIAAVCQAIEEAASIAGYQILLATPPDEVEAQLRSMHMLAARKIDGLIVSSIHLGRPEMVEQIRGVGIPVMAVNRHGGGGLPAVTVADRQGGILATEHLIGLGHSRIGVIAGPRHASTAWDRTQGYVQALRAAELEVDEDLIVHTDFEVQGGISGAHRLLNLPQPPTAIFSVNDTAAVGVLGAARDRGLSVPRDLSVVGYNDIPLVAQLPTPLTTVSSPAAPMGAVALQQLLRGIEGEEMSSMQLPVSLVIRSSTTIPLVTQ